MKKTNKDHFVGTRNPRHLRLLRTLLKHDLPREQADQVAGCSNAPQEISVLRDRGLEIPCEPIKYRDQDKKQTWYGLYSLTLDDRRKVLEWAQSAGIELEPCQ